MSAKDPGRELIDQFLAGQDTMARFQAALSQMTLPPEQRHALKDGLALLNTPGKQMEALIEMTKAFSPPVAQIQTLAGEISAQRAQLEQMTSELHRMDAAVNRLLVVAEQLAANQAAVVRLAEAWAPRPRSTQAGQ